MNNASLRRTLVLLERIEPGLRDILDYEEIRFWGGKLKWSLNKEMG